MNCRNVVTLAIPMPSDRGVLEVIEKLGFGRLESDGTRVNESVQDKVKQLLIRLLPKLHVLKYQATLALEAVGGTNGTDEGTRPSKDRLNQINLEMKSEKRKAERLGGCRVRRKAKKERNYKILFIFLVSLCQCVQSLYVTSLFLL